MPYTLKQLRYFVAAGNAESVTKASHVLDISQPSISAAITHLEAEFGLQLFVRHHAQGLSLTPAGRRLMTAANRLLTQSEDLYQFASDLNEGLAGTLDVGCFLTLAPIMMPGLLRDFAQRYPTAKVGCVEGHQAFLLNGLSEGRFEIALTYDLQIAENVVFSPLIPLPPYVIVAPDSPLAARPEITLRELVDQPLVLLDLPLSRDYFLSLFVSARLEPTIAFRTESFDMARGLVANGFGYSFLNIRPANNQSLDGKTIVALPLADAPRPLYVGIARMEGVALSKIANAFAEHCVGAVARYLT